MIDVERLSPAYVERRPGEPRRHGAPRLVTLRGPAPYDGGSWFTLGPPSASGPDVISIVEFLGECDRRTAADFLRELTDRLVEVVRAA